jgi:hypothetical protein
MSLKLYHQTMREEHKQRLLAIKSDTGCVDCGVKNPIVLQFHHRDNGCNIGKLVSSNRTWNTIRAEIAKCDVLCANCHIIRHDKEQTGYFAQKVG